MKKQNYEIRNEEIRRAFHRLKKEHPEQLQSGFNLSWSSWGFGLEPLEVSAKRLEQAGIAYIELPGNHHGPDLGYRPREVLQILGDHGIRAAGICGLFSPDYDLSSNRPMQRQAAIDYLKRETEFAAAVGADYILIVPGAVGRPQPYDDTEFERSVNSLQLAAGLFAEAGVKGAIEPIRSEEVSLIHTIADAGRYIEAVNHPAIACINGDVYHMQTEEVHIGQAVLEAGDRLVNLHLADSNRRTLGDGFMDLDTIIMALYLNGQNSKGRYVTPEPLGPGGDPYRAMNGRQSTEVLDRLVFQSIRYLKERIQELLA